MMIRTVLALLLLLPAAAPAQDLDAAASAVVRISGTRGGTPVRGSGFVVGLDRDTATVLTASHVIEGVEAKQIEVVFAGSTQIFLADVILGLEAGNSRGLAVFQVRGALPVGVTALSFESERPHLGEALFLIGFPQMALRPRITQRVFSGWNGTLLEIDQGIGEGFSGGPVLKGGKVVGVVTETDEQTNYAVSALVAREALEGWGINLRGKGKTTPIKRTTAEKPASPEIKACVQGEERTENGVVFVHICPGTFMMGSAENDPRAYSGEKPAHQVTLSEFWIGKTEVTNEQYRRLRPNHQGEPNLPVTDVSWTDAEAACKHFRGRLPTEAEWEYAARAGSQTAWSFGDDEETLGEYAWYGKNAWSDNWNRAAKPYPVGTKKPNAWGLHDMYGNVWEWVADWYGTYPSVAQTDPYGPTTGEDRILRGGSFDMDIPRTLRSAVRGRLVPLERYGYVGFRCVQAPSHLPSFFRRLLEPSL